MYLGNRKSDCQPSQIYQECNTWDEDKELLDSMKAVNLAKGRVATVTTQDDLDKCQAAAEEQIETMQCLIQISPV